MYNENFDLDPFNGLKIKDTSDVFTEAVFIDGKKSVEPILEQVRVVKQLLLTMISYHEKSELKFDPKTYWKSIEFKKLENVIMDVFGFRYCSIEPYIEKYDPKSKSFESKEINCAVYHADRYLIDGLITNRGFYDKTHSMVMEIIVSLGLIKALEPEEILAAFLHEFGHNIDPANVTIEYTEVNILSKYLLERKSINKKEQNFLMRNKFTSMVVLPLMANLKYKQKSFLTSIKDIFTSKRRIESRGIDKIRTYIKNDKEAFNRQNYGEAYADNFARMYGYGAYLTGVFRVASMDIDKQINSRIEKEKKRQQFILDMTLDTLKDEHKSDIHRIRALIKEYKTDIADPNIPDGIKPGMKEDVAALERVLNEYMNNYSDFQNKINRVINEELEKLDPGIYHESEEITESKKEREKIQKQIDAITSAERSEFYKIHGRSLECSLAKDKNGYYIRTHRCRSKSYPEIKDIPKKDVEFVRSTS